MNKLTRLARSFIAHVSDAVRSLNARDSFQPAGCNNIMGLLLHLCDMDEGMRTWILRWIAYQLRTPGAKMTTALVINGRNFSKTMFFEDVLTALFQGRSRVIMADELHDKFTSWAAAPCSLVIVHGRFANHHAARMRAFITAQSVVVERRDRAPETRPNHLNFVFLSKGPDFLPDSVTRRFAVVEVPPSWPRHFHEAVHHEISQGGIAAFRKYLAEDLDMGSFNESTQPPQPKFQRRNQEAA